MGKPNLEWENPIWNGKIQPGMGKIQSGMGKSNLEWENLTWNGKIPIWRGKTQPGGTKIPPGMGKSHLEWENPASRSSSFPGFGFPACSAEWEGWKPPCSSWERLCKINSILWMLLWEIRRDFGDPGWANSNSGSISHLGMALANQTPCLNLLDDQEGFLGSWMCKFKFQAPCPIWEWILQTKFHPLTAPSAAREGFLGSWMCKFKFRLHFPFGDGSWKPNSIFWLLPLEIRRDFWDPGCENSSSRLHFPFESRDQFHPSQTKFHPSAAPLRDQQPRRDFWDSGCSNSNSGSISHLRMALANQIPSFGCSLWRSGGNFGTLDVEIPVPESISHL
ncbi:uncharacterized protein LOC132085483 isoform X1 [Ammospiza nelsoni]|uniref:uncharacterized protein LOC132085483 isoform X1 n=1 Tax=Ammospiza nelsoni TaxID=2857394 RepID=UPI00286C5F1A|nr:uncharacterized protein LOC132085483 isoform X1 [Ammospiza nelsoni]